ncbi:MAG TPA: DUF1858 domain-containing protein [Candidatus Deferrimicrobium sp.]|nr:DUF1858 domain-containing protein [Candidatus Deferrimicrobium sp.]
MDKIAQTTSVYELTEAFPGAIAILKELGFAPIANPVLRKTVARKINLAQAAKIKRMDPAELVRAIAQRLHVAFDDSSPAGGAGEVSVEDIFRAELGFVPPGIMAASKLGKQFGDIIAGYHHHIWGEEHHIPFKYKYLMALAAAVAVNDLERAKLEVRKSVLYGATLEMIKETVEMMVWLGGAPTLRANVTPILSLAEKLISEKDQPE